MKPSINGTVIVWLSSLNPTKRGSALARTRMIRWVLDWYRKIPYCFPCKHLYILSDWIPLTGRLEWRILLPLDVWSHILIIKLPTFNLFSIFSHMNPFLVPSSLPRSKLISEVGTWSRTDTSYVCSCLKGYIDHSIQWSFDPKHLSSLTYGIRLSSSQINSICRSFDLLIILEKDGLNMGCLRNVLSIKCQIGTNTRCQDHQQDNHHCCAFDQSALSLGCKQYA